MRLALPLELDRATLVGWRPGAPIAQLAGETMGTAWSVQLAEPPGFRRDILLAAIESRLEAILAEMSHWRAGSRLDRFNRAPAGTWITLPGEFARVMAAAASVWERSDGAFDPAVGALVSLWGFGPEPATARPDEALVAKALTHSGMARLAYNPQTHRLRQPGRVHLDLSGIAKGHAVDALGAVLQAHGCRHALVEIGGELLGLGLRPDGDPWWVDLETPDVGVPALRVALHQLAVATSGDYVRGRHTVDPRTGYPVDHAMAVSVLHQQAMMADAWATALSVAAPGAMEALATRECLAVRALIRKGETTQEWVSPALAGMMAET